MKSSWPVAEKLLTESTHRSRSPVETLAVFQPLMSRLGITRLANITGLDHIGIPVFVAFRPESRGLATAQGKGLDVAAARASALMEAIESWHAERIALTSRVEAYGVLRREGTVVEASALHMRHGRSLSSNRPIQWALAHELISGEPRWVPWDCVSCDFSRDVVRQATFVQTTNGLASGNHILEAILHGLCEVIERDAISLHGCRDEARQAARRIDLDTIQDLRSTNLLGKLRDADVDVALWDCTSDLGIPVISAMIMDSPQSTRRSHRGPHRGYGCHVNRDIALLRAVTEAVQSRVTYVSGGRDDLFTERFRALQRMEREDAVARQMLQPARRSFAEVPSIHYATFNADLAEILARLRASGLCEVAMVDLSRQDVGVPVVKVVVPGLENNIHHERHYRPGPRAARVLAGTS